MDALPGGEREVQRGCVDRPLLDVVVHLGRVTGADEGRGERRHDQGRDLAAGGVPADDAAVEQVADRGEVELAVTGRELGVPEFLSS